MSISCKWPIAIATSIAIGLAAGITVPEIAVSAPNTSESEQTSAFPDVESDYWAKPFIQALAEENIVVGYPDGRFKPAEDIDRDEFAALVRTAFDPDMERQIPSGSVFDDVPADYWAAQAIEQAYETGFLEAFANENFFYPRQEMTRAEAISALVRGLELKATLPESTTYQARVVEPVPQKQQRLVQKRRLVFPLAATALMQPFVLLNRAQTQTPPVAEEPDAGQEFQVGIPTADLNAYYTDADRIPVSERDDLAVATQANIVVNYPDPTLLNPNELLNRGAAAAIIYQTLVYQGRMQPLPENSEAAEYVVNPPTQVNEAQNSSAARSAE